VIISVIDKPASVCLEHPMAFFIGPTAVDRSPITEQDRQSAIRQAESKVLAQYRKRDFAHYSHQTKRPSWRH
jgi:hypothetical protein